jgi:predicted DNA binding protein
MSLGTSPFMWKVFGVEGTIPAFAEIWKQRMIELSKRKKYRERFLQMIEDSDVRYVLDAIREVHVFMVYLPAKYGREDLVFFKDFVVKTTKSAKVPTLEFNGMMQNHGVVITTQEEEDEYAERRKVRSKYLEAEEKRLKPKEGEESQGF